MSEFEEAKNKEFPIPDDKALYYEQFIDNSNRQEGADWAYSWFEDNVEGWIEKIIGSRDQQWAMLVAEKIKLQSENAELKTFINEIAIESQDERLDYITCQVDKELFFKFKQTNEVNGG